MPSMDDRDSYEVPFALVHPDDDGERTMLGDTLLQIAEQIAIALDCSECCVYEYIAEGSVLRAQARWTRVPAPAQNVIDWARETHRLSDAPGFARVVGGREVVVSYLDDEPEGTTAGDEGVAFRGRKAALLAPIVYEDRVLGMLELSERERERSFTADDVRLVGQMAGLAAVALHNAGLSRAAEERNRQLSALIGASRAMTSTLDLDVLLNVVCRQAALALDTGSSYIYEFDAETDAMVWLAEHQRDPSHAFEEPLGTVYPLEDLPQDFAVVRTRRPVEARLDDPDLDQVLRSQLLEWEEQSSLMVPLIVAGDVVGALEVSEAVYPRHFTQQEIALCVALGEQAAVAHSPRPAVPPPAGAEGDHRAAGNHRRPHGARQPPLLLGAPARRGRPRRPLRAAALPADARPRRLQARQRPVRAPHRRRVAASGRTRLADAGTPGC